MWAFAPLWIACSVCPWSEVAYPQVNDSIAQAYDDLDSGTFDIWQAEMTESRYELRPVSRTRTDQA
jgi:hypothetical protein